MYKHDRYQVSKYVGGLNLEKAVSYVSFAGNHTIILPLGDFSVTKLSVLHSFINAYTTPRLLYIYLIWIWATPGYSQDLLLVLSSRLLLEGSGF